MYNDFLFTTCNENPPCDFKSRDRDLNTKIAQYTTYTRPSTISYTTSNCLIPAELNTHYCQLVKVVRCHSYSKAA